MRLRALVLGLGFWLSLSGASRQAHAFEREWHLGVAGGIADGRRLKISPALGAYAAYGLSDVFDVRLEVTARGYYLGSPQNPNAISAMTGVAYKLDVLRWVPWAAVYAGYLGFLDVPRNRLTFKQHDVALGVGVGLDYAFSRQVGVGFTVRYDDALGRADTSTFDALLRAEYRWGW